MRSPYFQRLSQLTKHFLSTTRIMATTSEISIPFSDRVGFISLRGQRTPESFQIASELLTDNHVHHHVFFNDDGFHVPPPPPSFLSITL